MLYKFSAGEGVGHNYSLYSVCVRYLGEAWIHLKQPQAVSNALALMSSVKLINYINSITNKSNNECINLTIFTSQKVAKLLVGKARGGWALGCFSNDSLCNL